MTGEVHAQFSTGFETSQSSGSSGYIAGNTIIGVQDVQAPSGNRWTTLFGAASDMTATADTPASGGMAFQIMDSSTSTACGAYVNLAGTTGLDLTRSFTLSFSMKLSGISVGTNNQAQVYFGAPSTDSTANKYWAILMYDNGNLTLYVTNSAGTGATVVTLGSYSAYSNNNTGYVRVSITVDPLLKKYSKITLSGKDVAGNDVTNDFTAAVQAVNDGVIPWLPAVNPSVNPAANLLFVTGVNDTLTAKFDDILVTNDSHWYEAYAPGVILPDQGTIEMTLSPSRDIAQFGNSGAYDFLFKVLPDQKLPSGGNTLMGLYVPSAGAGTGLWGLTRNATGAVYATYPSFAPAAGQLVRVAMTWGGGAVKTFVNGSLVVSASSTIGNLPTLPATFRVEKQDPFHVSEVKISDVALPTASLSSNPAVAMTAGTNTTLLASAGLSRTQYFHTARQTALGYSSLVPRWRIEDQTLTEGTSPTYTLLGINHSGTSATYSINIKATDRLGTSVLDQTWPVSIAANSTYSLTSLPLTALSTRGFYELHTTITSPSLVVTTYDSSIAICPANDTTVADGSWDHYLGQNYDIAEHPTSAVALNRMGIKTNRVFGDLSSFFWFSVQPAQGTGTSGFTWARTDLVVQQARAAHIELLGILGFPPPWAAVDPGAAYKSLYSAYSMMSGRWKPRSSTEWGNYIYQVVSRYKNDVKNWEIGNEMDWHPTAYNTPYYCFSGTTLEYLSFLQTAYTQAKLADPTCNVLMNGFALGGADLNMPYDLLNAGAASSFDTFASHGYDSSKIVSLNTALNAKKPGAPHWMTEQMWDSISYDQDRLFLTPYLYLEYLEQGIKRFYQFGFSGLCFDSYTFSPTIDSYVQGVFASQIRKTDAYIGKYTFTGSDAFGIRHYFTRKDGKILSLIGSELARNNVTVTGSILSAVDSYGNSVPTTSGSGNTVLDIADVAYIVSNAPLVITNVELTQAAPLLLNGGFEDIAGDLQTGGLASCTPLDWTLRKTDYDPSGQINLTTSSHLGTYGLTMYCSGGNQANGQPKKVYAFQDVRISTAGTYQITAYFKRVNAGETAIPYLSFYNRDTGVVTTQTYPTIVAGGDYTVATSTLVFTAPQTQSAAVMAGISQGAGTVLVDDVTFVRTGD